MKQGHGGLVTVRIILRFAWTMTSRENFHTHTNSVRLLRRTRKMCEFRAVQTESEWTKRNENNIKTRRSKAGRRSRAIWAYRSKYDSKYRYLQYLYYTITILPIQFYFFFFYLLTYLQFVCAHQVWKCCMSVTRPPVRIIIERILTWKRLLMC